jgi:hypothetical protein
MRLWNLEYNKRHTNRSEFVIKERLSLNLFLPSQISFGLDALKVLRRALLGALLMGFTLGNLIPLANCLLPSLFNSWFYRVQVFTI